MGGVNFDLKSNKEILKINSPKSLLEGPYTVVYKHLIDRWAIVAFDWDGKPSLGMRWFWDALGNPVSNRYPIWHVIPTYLSKIILKGLPIDNNFSNKIEDFLAGNIGGEELSKI